MSGFHFNSESFCQQATNFSNFHYVRHITPKRVTSGGIHLRDSASGQHSSEETSQRWRHCVQFDRPENRAPNLPHRYRCAQQLSKPPVKSSFFKTSVAAHQTPLAGNTWWPPLRKRLSTYLICVIFWSKHVLWWRRSYVISLVFTTWQWSL